MITASLQPLVSIGVIHTPLSTAAAAPVQGRMRSDLEGEVLLEPVYAEGLADLDGFSHLLLLYVFHQARSCKLKVTPYLDSTPRGLFVTRAPARPNPIGVTVVRLLGIDGRRLRVAGVDMLDGTPLLDIKPYVPAFDAVAEARCGWLEPRLKEIDRGEREPVADDRFHLDPQAVNCAACDNEICHQGTDCGVGIDSSRLYEQEPDRRLFAVAAEVEAEGYCKLGRIEELILFCEKLGIRRLGLAFCVGLAEEARLLHQVLGERFDLTSVCCKLCSLSKDELGVRKIHEDRFESACNPVGQARALSEAGTELNVIVGLCIGHDILFTKHSTAPVTTLVVKDRVLGHNPVAALHSSYHRRRLVADKA